MEQTILSKNFLDKFGPDICKTLIKRWIFDDSDEIEIMLLYRSASKFWNVSGGHFDIKCFLTDKRRLNSTVILSKAHAWRASDKTVILQCCF